MFLALGKERSNAWRFGSVKARCGPRPLLENAEADSLSRVDAGCAFNPSKTQESSTEQNVEKLSNGGADGHGSPRLDRARAGFRTRLSEGHHCTATAEALARRGAGVLAGR
jgi:hypothetical protein